MKKIFLGLMLLMIGCSERATEAVVTANNGTNGTSCSVYQMENGARITCGNTVAFIYNGMTGATGEKGDTGLAGQNGASCSMVRIENGVRISCGEDSQDLFNGLNGTNGQAGAVGATGAVGPVGPQGPQGQAGTNALANAIGIAGYIYPCGNEFDNDEIFLRLTDGKILALYDGGPNEDRLALLAPGNYRTTDRNGNQVCNVNVSSTLVVTSSLGQQGNH